MRTARCLAATWIVGSVLWGLPLQVATAQQSPYARGGQEKTPLVLPAGSVTDKGVGAWQFGLTPQEILQTSDCGTSTIHTTSVLGRTVKEPYLSCKVWISGETVGKGWLYFRDNQLYKISIHLGKPEDANSLSTLIQQSLQFWQRLQLGTPMLYEGTHAQRAFPSMKVDDIEQSLRRQAQAVPGEGRLAVALRKATAQASTQLLFLEPIHE